MPEPRAFSDIPGQPGVTYAPAEPWWKGPARVRPEAREEAVTFPRPPAIGEGFMTPDYSNRSLFEKHVFGEIGGDPFKLNPRDALQFADENLPDLFERFFQGTVVWEDRGKLTKDQGTQWDEVIKSYHAWALKEAEMQKAVMTDRYTFMMSQFDTAAKEYQTALTKVRARREAIAALKRTKEKEIAKAVPKEPTTADVKRGSDMLRNIEKTMAKNVMPSQAQLDMYNMLARKVGAPEVEFIEEEIDPNVITYAWDWWGALISKQEQRKRFGETELKKKPSIKPKPVSKKRPKAGTAHKLDPNNKADVALAKRFLKKAGGDVRKARQLAKERGYSF